MSKVNAKNQIRRTRILRALLDHGHLSMTDVARTTGMTLPMVSRIVGVLKRSKLVVTSEERTTDGAGRPATVVKLNGKAGIVLGIDMGHLNTNMVLLDLEQNIVGEVHHQSLPLSNDPSLIAALRAEVRKVLKKAGVSNDRLRGIGISIPGIVRGREGISETYLNFGRPLQAILEEEFRKTVHVEHDAKAMALGERWFGAARGVSNALCLNIGWGLGMGIILDGRLYYGRDGYAGEFGHILAVPNGPLCYCGKRGCLETVASGMAIARTARGRITRGEHSMLSELMKGNLERIDAEQVLKAALAGDESSIEILNEAGRYLGEGVAKLINLFNPEMIVFGGRVSRAGEFILGPIRSTAMKQSLVQLGRNVKFTISPLGTRAGALGVATLAARDTFDVERLNPSAFV